MEKSIFEIRCQLYLGFSSRSHVFFNRESKYSRLSIIFIASIMLITVIQAFGDEHHVLSSSSSSTILVVYLFLNVEVRRVTNRAF
jgi:hypothetical protein